MGEAVPRPRYVMHPALSDFLILYDRFEFAMKRTDDFGEDFGSKATILANYGTVGIREQEWRARSASWQKLGKKLPANVLQGFLDNAECSILWLQPPNTFGRASGSNTALDWGLKKPEGMDLRDPLKPIRVVRNMQAHGDSPGLHGRGLKLVNAALFILENIILQCNGIEEFAQFFDLLQFHEDECARM